MHRSYWRNGRTEWVLAGVLLAVAALMVVYPPSMWWDLAAGALAVGYYIGLRHGPERR